MGVGNNVEGTGLNASETISISQVGLSDGKFKLVGWLINEFNFIVWGVNMSLAGCRINLELQGCVKLSVLGVNMSFAGCRINLELQGCAKLSQIILFSARSSGWCED